ncbi:MotA/TolQ/ExbB proton channel family protein [Acidovorax sp. FJL06]|uniref:MotA/TolQ/ExbB proton channel family protein n=1 Tax=Acidovorax sp. FJL06 TaxID=2153365 RepID=UPI000F581C25|nr:MotA/TolQ/ExbB proton channel family protein [Acidovorax sp. FJL06]RQO81144.1 flagellar motor protein MotA [Acidovorax sp. FJL06]
MDALHWWRQGDAVTQTTALVLLAMSVASWVVIVWKLRLMRRASADVARCTAAFWQAPSLALATERLQSFDREALVLPLVGAANSIANRSTSGAQATLATAGSLSQQLTRVLRDALHQVLGRLQLGQVLLATVGSTAPFVGLLGTVWGIYHALTAMAGAGQITIDRVSGPVGEALVMTAAGLAVAIPAVLAYNWFGRLIGRIEADLEGFARDLRELLIDTAPVQSLAGTTEGLSNASRPAAGPPQGGSAPLGGSEPRAAGSVGA